MKSESITFIVNYCYEYFGTFVFLNLLHCTYSSPALAKKVPLICLAQAISRGGWGGGAEMRGRRVRMYEYDAFAIALGQCSGNAVRVALCRTCVLLALC